MEQLIQSGRFTVWQLIKLYWRSQHKMRAYGWYIFLLLVTTGVVITELALTYWSNYFYTALQDYNQSMAVRLLGLFFFLAFCFITLVVCRYYVTQMFSWHWRQWLTKQFLQRWLTGRGYYYLETFDQKTDNPDQRIQDDVGGLIANSLDLSLSLFGNILSLVGYCYVLWSLSGNLFIPLGSLGTFVVHHYLLWVSLIYTVLGTLITFKIGRPLISLSFEQQHREATFRFAAIDVRSHAENIALYRGEEHQKGILQNLFSWVLDNWYSIIVRQTKLLSFTSGFGQLSVALPLIVVLPNYFDKVILLGGLMQSLRAFSGLQDALSFFVNSYPQIASWRATGQRLTSFLNHIIDVEDKVGKHTHVRVHEAGKADIITKKLTIKTPRDELLLKDINELFKHGQSYVIKGPSGVGKSTFIRALAGIWPFTSGEITYPEASNVMFLPQRPYMPIGTLQDAIIFPDKPTAKAKAQLKSVLKKCDLTKFIPRLHEHARWSEQLSPGEQQRIAFARVLLQKPDWVFMDESTSMLDVPSEKHLYEMIKENLPNCSVVSVGHRPSVDGFHDHVIDMEKYT